MIKGGTGGSKTVAGLKFESRVDLKTAISGLPGYSVEKNNVFFDGKKVGEVFKKEELYKGLLKLHGIEYRKILSQKLLPDNAIFILRNKTLFIIEVKFQEVPGSVDEKLQTCDFKLRQYKRLFEPLGITVKYAYVLNDRFKNPRYKDVLAYIEKVGCSYFYNEIPLAYLGLPSAKKEGEN